jgi:prepilin-type N-terminal cleavage/methylation domain-containing protein
MSKKRGFTLIELLVVIAIIALLMSILMPALSKVRKQALTVVCRSRMKQWGVVYSMYTGDNDGFFLSRTQADIPGYAAMWPYAYKKWYIDPKMRFCPNAENARVIKGPFAVWWYAKMGSFRPTLDPRLLMPGEREYDPDTGTVTEGFFTGSVGQSRYIENVKGGTAGTNSDYFRKVDVKGGDKVPIMLDCMYLYHWPGATATPPQYNGDYTPPEMRWICMDRHMGFNNVCFLDFSARKVGLKELYTLKHSRSFNICEKYTICGNGGGGAGKSAARALWDTEAEWMSKMPVY